MDREWLTLKIDVYNESQKGLIYITRPLITKYEQKNEHHHKMLLKYLRSATDFSLPLPHHYNTLLPTHHFLKYQA